MGAIVPIFVIAGISLVIGVFILIAIQMEKKRTTAFGEFAEQLGLPFHPAGESGLEEALSHFKLFNTGSGRKFKNAIVGETDELKLAIFDYQYTTGSGKHSHTHLQTVASLESNLLRLPEFAMQPEHFFHKVGAFFGSKDIDFESHPDFSAAFHLKGPDEEAIREAFYPTMLEFFEQHRQVTLVASGNRVIYFRAGKRVKPIDLRGFLEQGYEIFALLTENPSLK